MAASISTGFLLFDLLFVLAGAFLAFYVYYKHSYQYWKKRGVPYLEPKFPCGNNDFFFAKSPTFAGEARIWYEQLKKKGLKFGGAYSFAKPVLVLVDPDYIKDVLSKDFHNFADRDFFVNEEHDPMGTNLFNIGNANWKGLRQKFTPTFTSGKMKNMFHTIVSSSNNLIDHLETCTKMGDDIDIRQDLASFTIDVIGSVAFGLECNSFTNTHAEFKKQGLTFFDMTPMLYVKAICSRLFPKLSKKLGMTLGKEGPKIFFSNAIKNTVEYRAKNNIRRNDFLQILIDMNNETKDQTKKFSFEEMVSNSILFFIAGFDTSSTLMTYTLYELAKNPDVQDKLRAEINAVLKKHNGQVTYEALQEMTYLQKCLYETMRIHPPVISLARICTKDYQLNGTDVTIEKGTAVTISTIGIGRDPEIFPDPMKFDPNRFSPEEIAKRHPYVHLPFGEGPRNCIGLRFGKMQSEIGLVRVLSNFKFTISPKTKVPLDYKPRLFLLKETETLYLRSEKV